MRSEAGDHAGAIESFRKALKLRESLVSANPTVTQYETDLGRTLHRTAQAFLADNRLQEAKVFLLKAIVHHRKALNADPRNVERRRFVRQVLADLLHANEALSDQAAVAQTLGDMAELAETDPAGTFLDERLKSLLAGQAAKNDAESLQLAHRAYDRGLHVAVVRLWSEALRANPKLAEDRNMQVSYNAACSAASASAGASRDQPPPDAATKATLRGQALEWLRAELNFWTTLLETGPARVPPEIAHTLEHWQICGALVSVRDTKELNAIPEAERVAWKTLWADVTALISKAQAKALRK